MTGNAFVKMVLIEELRWKTRLSDRDIVSIVDGFMEKLDRRRYTVVPTYLTDDMYDAQKEIDPDIRFDLASKLYRSALVQWNSLEEIPKKPDEDGSFW